MERVPSGLMPLGLLRDALLVRLASRGDEAAFAAIFRRYHQPLYRYCRAITGNGEDASDALQNTMVKAMRALPGERRPIELKPWLFRVAHNESVSLLRRRPSDAALEKESDGPAVDGPEVGLLSREELRELISDLRELPQRQQAAVILRELNGLSYAEIASVFDTSTAAAKQAAYDGRVALQDYAKGRAMDCETVTRAISDGDGRFLRARKSRGHLRSCPECSSFKQALDARSVRLGAIAPALPATTAAALIEKLVGGGGLAGGGAVGASTATGKLVASAGAFKSATAVVAAASVAAGAAVGGAQLVRNDRAAQLVGERGGPAAIRGADAPHSASGRRSGSATPSGPGADSERGERGERVPLVTPGRPARGGPANARRTTPPLSGGPGRRPPGAGQGHNAAAPHGPTKNPAASRPERPSSPVTPSKREPPTPRTPATREIPKPQTPPIELLPNAPVDPSARAGKPAGPH